MQNLLRFIRMYNVLIVFLFFQGISINLYLKNNSFQNSIALEHANNYKGEIYTITNNINEYFKLKNINMKMNLFKISIL